MERQDNLTFSSGAPSLRRAQAPRGSTREMRARSVKVSSYGILLPHAADDPLAAWATRDGRAFSKGRKLTFGGHFRVARLNDALSQSWCVQRTMNPGKKRCWLVRRFGRSV